MAELNMRKERDGRGEHVKGKKRKTLNRRKEKRE